ncbi:MAG: SsrA-binding protein SmpB [Candidatus Carbobacillus altaicus]|uniref:SsrA-binding protein n=1 Tax=Candidatus Carbonibacillus altaicus TaxID=2163959 RepID=A0A2R6Y4U3_9BACL|nr:SsrA-binding protein SmpB [Candidatus Carbobacillus altaicus]PTQ57672.1 MAG: tmRNA-binding protein SmpB [Candidatus Carbobacillus altaicus]
MSKTAGEEKVLAQNRKARHDYFIEETYEAGIVLTGTEVKAVRQGKVNLKDSFARFKDGELFLLNMHISPYAQGNRFNHDPLRTRKLLLKRRELDRLQGLVQQQGYALVPLLLYLKGGLIKVELALAKGKKLYDKREAMKEQAVKREVERHFRERQKE